MNKTEIYNKIMDKVAKEVKKALNENTSLLDFDDNSFNKSKINSENITKDGILRFVKSLIIEELANDYNADETWVSDTCDYIISGGVERLPYASIEHSPSMIDGDLSGVQYVIVHPRGHIYTFTEESLNTRILELLITKRLLENDIEIEVDAYELLEDVERDLNLFQNLKNIKTTYCWTTINYDNEYCNKNSDIKHSIGIKYY